MNKNLKPIVIIIIIFLCAIACISCFYYEKTVQTFSPMCISYKVSAMNENNASYNELKKSLKEKYSNQFLQMLKVAKQEYSDRMREILGNDYTTLSGSLAEIENQIRTKRHDFLNSEEYLTAKTEMTNAKLKFDLSKESDKEENEKALQNAVSNVSTLNTKLNNQLKDLYQEENSIKTKLVGLFNSKKIELIEVKNQTEEKTKTEISKLLYTYFVELKNLNQNFGVDATNNEMPFNDDFVKTFNVYTDFEKSYFNGSLTAKTQVNSDIITENTTILN